MEEEKPSQETTATKECKHPSSNNHPVLENTDEICSQDQDSSNNHMEKILSSVKGGDREQRPKLGRKRSSSLSNLSQLKQFLEAESNQYERNKLRRVSSIPVTCNSGEQETQLEDGLLTTTLCSTEL